MTSDCPPSGPNPYADLPDHQFWRRSISNVEAHLIDPVVAPRFRIGVTDRVATAGSCFAQNIARRLRESGYNYFVTEPGRTLEEAARRRRQFGVFSARYGNIYTTAQLNQLLAEALGEREPGDSAWQRPDGRWIDPYRQQVEPGGFASPEDVGRDRAHHLDRVRQMATECDLFVFTLGLTEAWRSRADGQVYPLAPGVVASAFDPERHEYVNFGVDEVAGDLAAALRRMKRVNPAMKALLTVSPVPLIATFENRSVLTSTIYSKSVLRVAADLVIRELDWVDYFPSYEIITGSQAERRYFEDDARDVSAIGVAHAMRSFFANYTEGGAARAAPRDASGIGMAVSRNREVICDEETIDAVRDRPA
jgi:hypothetical protein